MRARRLSEIAAVTGGRVAGADVEVRGVTVDSRSAKPADLFVALDGENHDGHRFVTEAMKNGATAALVNDESSADGPAVVVSDTLRALADLAADERRGSNATVIGITGSTGKTMTKDLVRAVLATRFDVEASPGSFNNEIGLPLTLLAATGSTEVVVAEMGSRGIGHIAALCRIAEPDVGVITNVGEAHMELFGSREEIAKAKRELIESLSGEGTAVLPADDPVAAGFGANSRAAVITFGVSSGASVRAERIELDDEGLAVFELWAGGDREPVRLAIPGEHMVANALAAAATGVALGLSAAEISSGLKDAPVSAWRMETFTTPGGVRVVNDAYNANPTSMAAALKTARWIARKKRMCAVLGTMRELGEISVAEHERIGELVARLGVERLVTVGAEAEPMARAAVREGVEPENVASYEAREGALEDVLGWARSGDVVLFKGSRAIGLERLAEAMR